jgi:hypothetical protein
MGRADTISPADLTDYRRRNTRQHLKIYVNLRTLREFAFTSIGTLPDTGIHFPQTSQTTADEIQDRI